MAEREPGFTAIGDAADVRALVEGVMALQPDVVVADMSMPELNGIDAVKQLRSRGYRGIIVMFSVHDERRFVSEARRHQSSRPRHSDCRPPGEIWPQSRRRRTHVQPIDTRYLLGMAKVHGQVKTLLDIDRVAGPETLENIVAPPAPPTDETH